MSAEAASRASCKLAVASAAMGVAALSSVACSAFVPSAAAPPSAALRGAPATTAPSATPSARAAPASSATAALTVGLVAGGLAAGARQRRSKAARRVATLDQQVTTQEKKDLASSIPDCPRTIWKADNIDVLNLPPVTDSSPLIIDANDLGVALKRGAEVEWFTSHRDQIKEQVTRHGAIWFRNFDLTKDAAGFRAFYEALQLNPCLDPIHTSGLRDMVEKKDAVYEAVNKPSLAQHYIGLHNESTYVKTAAYGAFVCFQPASEGGGEFTLADGAKIIADMRKDVLQRIYERKVRISVSNLDLNFLDVLPLDSLKESAKGFFQDLLLKFVAPKFDMDLEMIFGADRSNPYRLQAIEHAQPPINTHPVTGRPVWFCNIHNHSRYLRDRRPCTVPEVGMTDVYYGDLSKISPEDVSHINEVAENAIVSMKMKEGDVVLVDNYRVLHGRKTFKGSRKHAVTWFESWGEPLARDEQRDRPDMFMNNLINKTLV